MKLNIMTALLSTSMALALAVGSTSSARAAENESINGTYQAILEHEPRTGDTTKYYQYATMTLRTVNPGNGTLKISANVRIFFGGLNSTEFFSYEYPEVSLNMLTRQVSFKNDASDVAFVGQLKDGEITGDWFASVVGRVGRFAASKRQTPEPAADTVAVRTVTGHYLGSFENTNPSANLPERMSVSLVTTQAANGVQISGSMRFYLGAFGSNEYLETKLKDVQFNYYNRFLTVRTEDHGVTLKGTLTQDGVFTADVYADGFGKVGRVKLGSQQ